MRRLLFILPFVCFPVILFCQSPDKRPYYIENYNIAISVNEDASLNITEDLRVVFNEPRHGIIRKIPFKYKLRPTAEGVEKADLQMASGNTVRTVVEDIKVPGQEFKVSTEGDYKTIKIGSADKYVPSNVQYVIEYRVLNAISFFKDHSELYFNLIGNEWDTEIDSANFSVHFFNPLADTTGWFLTTGNYGSNENNAIAHWQDNQTFVGHTLQPLAPYEALTIGLKMPDGYLKKPDYRFRGIAWLLLPAGFFAGLFLLWKRYGKDAKRSVQTEFYPPENISPSEAGYLIDGKLNRRDLTALVPYWGAEGHLQINEIENKAFLGMIKTTDYEFVKLKELPSGTPLFALTMFNAIFHKGDKVLLSSLKNNMYSEMAKAKKQLESAIDKGRFYEKYSRGLSVAIPIIGLVLLFLSFQFWALTEFTNIWMGVSLIVTCMLIVVFGFLMKKKTKKGTEVYYSLLGFKEFIQTVEKDRLATFLKQDPNYFDKVLPFAIVFNVADKWKDKLKGLDIPPPGWYHGYYPGNSFSTYAFMSSLDRSLNSMSSNFYSAPPSSSGGSFSGGGGFSGGGFGGGGGSSW